MAAALRRPALTLAAAFWTTRVCSTAFSEPLSYRRYVTRAPLAEMLLDHDAPTKVQMLPNILQPRVVLYDGVCHLSHAGVKRIISADKDRNITFCCVQSKEAEPYLKVCRVRRKDVLRRSFVFYEGPGSYHQGSAAALRVCSYLPLPYSALRALVVVPRPLRDAVYDYVAKRRYGWYGRGDDCLVLKEIKMLERFIDWEELLDRMKPERE
ncbi:hypothetical protein AAHA92_18811 [Salvia divinorum]|uniref:Thiol-disulfide oxidoreductase DCC n=1 Tax=Salvia divinorum TaxID=28513 RepID=A0ABD1H645_SALDI